MRAATVAVLLASVATAAAQPADPYGDPAPAPPPPAAPLPPPPPPPASTPAQSTVLDRVQDTIEDAKRLHRSLGTILEVAYALSTTDPDELGRLPSVLYGAMLAEIRKDPVASALFDNMVRQYSGGYLRASLLAGASADLSTPGAVTASVDASYELPLCRVLGAHAQGLAGYDGDTIASWALGGTACLPLPANTLQITYTRRNNIRGSLLRRPVVLLDRREEHVVNGLLRFYRWSGQKNVVDVSPLTVDVVATTSDESGVIAGQTGSFTVAPAVWYRKGKGLAGSDMIFRFMNIKAFFHSDDTGIGGRYTSTVAITPLLVENVPITDQISVSVDLGFGLGSVYESDDLPANPDPNVPPPPALVERNLAHFEAWADFVKPPFAGRLKVGHTLLPAYGGQMILEDRATLRNEIALPYVAARAEGFVGNARVVRIGTDEIVKVYGGAGDVAYAIVPHVHAIARLEIANIIAAGLDTEPAKLQREVRATIGVTAHLDEKW